MRPDAEHVTPAALAAAASWIFAAEYVARTGHPNPRTGWRVALLERVSGCPFAPDVLYIGCDAQGYYVSDDYRAARANETTTRLLRERIHWQREQRVA